MDEFTLSQQNPWVNINSSFGSLRNVLCLAEQNGYFQQHSNVGADILSSKREQCQSLLMCDLMKDIDQSRKATNKVNLEIQKLLQDKETMDITHPDILEQRLAKMNELSAYMQEIVVKKERLQTRLQQPHVGEYLKVDAAHKRFVCEVFRELVPILSDLTRHLDDIEWSHRASRSNSQMELVLGDISSILASIQGSLQSLCQMRHSFQQLCNQRSTSR